MVKSKSLRTTEQMIPMDAAQEKMKSTLRADVLRTRLRQSAEAQASCLRWASLRALYAQTFSQSSQKSGPDSSPRIPSKFSCYGTAIFVPANHKCSFPWSYKQENIDDTQNKRAKAPLMLISHNYHRGMRSFPGGGNERGETPLECINREFSEETGCSSDFFDESDKLFSVYAKKRRIYMYVKIVDDLSQFNALLQGIYASEDANDKSDNSDSDSQCSSSPSLTGYIEEVYGLSAIPMAYEPHRTVKLETTQVHLPSILAGCGEVSDLQSLLILRVLALAKCVSNASGKQGQRFIVSENDWRNIIRITGLYATVGICANQECTGKCPAHFHCPPGDDDVAHMWQGILTDATSLPRHLA